jgi:hypothetical protein
MFKKFILTGNIVFLTSMTALAQCAMCRTQVVNNVSAGETSFAAGINTGILYLFFTPYVLIACIVFFWFRYSRVNERKRDLSSIIRGKLS